MDDSNIIQLTILWFVILVFIQTRSGGSGPLLTAIGVLAIFLAYIIPVAILGLLGIRLLGE
jgi:lipopolysaccharide export LptBFGC system permease protein LptF